VKSLWRLFPVIVCLSLADISASRGGAGMLEMDQKYAPYRNFGIFYLKVKADYGAKEKSLVLESDIRETTMHVEPGAESREAVPTVKKFYKKMELYFDGKEKPSIVMDLTPLHFENSISVPIQVIADGYVADSLEIKLSRAELKKFRKLKPETAQVVLRDGEGKIVTAAEAHIEND
jgi:hypothetical protein